MHRFPLIIYTMLAAIAFLGGIRNLHFYQDFNGTNTELVLGIFLLISSVGIAYYALILNDRWIAEWERQSKIPKVDASASTKKDQDA